MSPYIDVIIQKGTDTDRQYLLNRVRDTSLGGNVSVVYIYELVNESVNYPNKSGHIIYIGEAGRTSEPTGKRFSQHISTGPYVGGDSGTIYSLSRYYWQGKSIRLKVFITKNRQDRKIFERDIINAHVKEYGSLPICQGTTGSNYKTSVLSSMVVSASIRALL
jgi:hypothetical protein